MAGALPWPPLVELTVLPETGGERRIPVFHFEMLASLRMCYT